MSAADGRVAIGQRYGDSDTGRKRRRNEDSFVCDPPLFAVADGMGGAQAGEVASALAAAALLERSDREAGGEAQIVEAQVVELVREANRRVHQRALDDASASGMGTTMTVALFGADGAVTIGHVGDSRAYMLRDGELEQLTEDHSLVAELVRRGELSQAEAEVHPQRSVITRVLGTEPQVDVDVFTVPARADDVFLLCSDGLTAMVDASGIAELVVRHRDDLREATRALIEAANDHGGDDNVTAVLFEIAEDDATAESITMPDPDEEDTLHPEDGVVLPPLEERTPETATPETGTPETGTPDAGHPEKAPPAADDTVIVSAAELYATTPEAASEGDVDVEPPAPLWRKMLALLVIVLLAGVIAVLVARGLAR